MRLLLQFILRWALFVCHLQLSGIRWGPFAFICQTRRTGSSPVEMCGQQIAEKFRRSLALFCGGSGGSCCLCSMLLFESISQNCPLDMRASSFTDLCFLCGNLQVIFTLVNNWQKEDGKVQVAPGPSLKKTRSCHSPPACNCA